MAAAPGFTRPQFLTPSPTWRTIRPDRAEIGEFIGSGAEGRVFAATFKGTKIALKKIPINNQDNQKHLETELAILASLDHQNIMKLIGASLYYDTNGNETTLYQFLELATEGTLYDVLR